MKKIFLLSLLSVFFLSAFCQITGTTEFKNEIISKINIIRSADEANDDDYRIFESYGGQGPDLAPSWPRWWFLYKVVRSYPTPDGYIVECFGNGWRFCMRPFKDIFASFRGLPQEIPIEAMEATYQNLIADSEEQAANGVYKGSITKKIASTNAQIGYLLFQMNWDYDPENPYNGKAEIIISKTNNFGIRY